MSAALLLYGKAGLTEFTDEVVRRKEVQDMIPLAESLREITSESCMNVIHLMSRRIPRQLAQYSKPLRRNLVLSI